jgi:uncharacterized protein YcnI
MSYSKLFSIFSTLLVSLFVFPTLTFAHVVVKPNQVPIAAFQTFTIGVPSEKDNPTVAVRLVIPEGVSSVSPNVKPGWTIEIKKEGDGENAKVTEISWTGGSIPEGQRDDFVFSAQAPKDETTLIWKAYQTYQDGTVVSWDQDPKQMAVDHMDEANEPTPYSTTQVINDLKTTPTPSTTNNDAGLALPISLLSLCLSLGALTLHRRKHS